MDFNTTGLAWNVLNELKKVIKNTINENIKMMLRAGAMKKLNTNNKKNSERVRKSGGRRSAILKKNALRSFFSIE